LAAITYKVFFLIAFSSKIIAIFLHQLKKQPVMKKQFLFLAGSAIILASCGSNNNDQPPAPTQAQIDSAMNAKLAEHDAANAAKNDSTLKAIEKEKADAAMKERNDGKKRTDKKPAPAPTPTVAPTKPEGGLRGRSDQNQNKTTTPNGATNTGKSGGLRGRSDQNQGR